jgi:hypothetical protein
MYLVHKETGDKYLLAKDLDGYGSAVNDYNQPDFDEWLAKHSAGGFLNYGPFKLWYENQDDEDWVEELPSMQ